MQEEMQKEEGGQWGFGDDCLSMRLALLRPESMLYAFEADVIYI